MIPAEARAILLAAEGDEDPVTLPATVLNQVTARDIPDGVSIQIGTLKENVIHLEWEGRLCRDGESVLGEAEYIWTRKYWYSPLGLEQYMDLVRRAVETRHRIHGDVELTHWDDDGAYIQLQFAITTGESNAGRAFETVRMVVAQVEEASEQAADEVGKRIAEVAARLSGWLGCGEIGTAR